MKKTILITGSTDGIGLETAKLLVEKGHKVILHGRSLGRIERAKIILYKIDKYAELDSFIADFSSMDQVKKMAREILLKHYKIDVLINNAGVFISSDTKTVDNLELRFAVNTIAPYLLTKLLYPVLDKGGRVVNLSSASQATVSINALSKYTQISDKEAYAQSKLALTMWSFQMARDIVGEGSEIAIVAVNPKSFLGSKMTKEAYDRDGHDLKIGADILWRVIDSYEFKDANGKYYDNDYRKFMLPHPDLLDESRRKEVIDCIETIVKAYCINEN